MKLFNTELILVASVCWLSLLTVTDARVLKGNNGKGGGGGKIDPMISGGTKVEFVGAAPKFKYFKDKDSNDFVMVDFKQINEFDGDTKERSLTGWASKGFTWTSDTFTNDDGVEVVTVTLSLTDVALKNCGGSSNDKASFNVTCYMPQGNTTINDIDVPAGGFKFALQISKWDFCGDNNELQFWFQLKGSNGKKDESSKSVTFQEGKVVFEDRVTIDGTEDDVKDVEISDENVRIRYPHFDSTLWYDPTVTGDGDGGDENGALLSSSASVSLPLACTLLAGLLLAFF